MTPMNKGKVVNILEKKVKYNGKEYSSRVEFVKDLLDKKYDISIDNGRYRLNIPNSKNGVDITKTEYDYANFIKSNNIKTKSEVPIRQPQGFEQQAPFFQGAPAPVAKTPAQSVFPSVNKTTMNLADEFPHTREEMAQAARAAANPQTMQAAAPSPADELAAIFGPTKTGEIPTFIDDFNIPEKVGSLEKKTPLAQKVNLLDWVRTPYKILDKFGGGVAYRKLIKAAEDVAHQTPINLAKITEWSKQVPKASNERIFHFLDGAKIQLDPVETRVAMEIKTWLAEWADKLGMSQDARITDYITHIFPLKSGGEIPEEIATLILNKTPKSVYDPFLLPRKGAVGYKTDTWAALDAYVKRATRKTILDPALLEFSEAVKHIDEPTQLTFINKKISALNMRPTDIENQLDNTIKLIAGSKLGPRPTAMLTVSARKMLSRAKIGGSLVSFAKNLTQSTNTFGELGTRYTLSGAMDLVKFGAKELNEMNVLSSSIIEDRSQSAIKKVMQKFDDVLFLNMNASELVNRGVAYYGAKAKFIANKITDKEFKNAFGYARPANYKATLQDAMDYGKFAADKTQFRLEALQTPLLINGNLSKTAMQFQSFGLKQAEFIGDMIAEKEISKLVRYGLGSTLLFSYVGSAFGMQWQDSLWPLRWGYPPVVQFAMDLWNTGVKKEDKYGNKLTTEKQRKAIAKSFFVNVMPMGAQLQRGTEGFLTVNAGKSVSPSNKFEYEVDQSPMNYIRGTLFGKYNLPESKEYYKKKEEKANAAVKSKSSSGSSGGSWTPL
jgi:hypothetical protein